MKHTIFHCYFKTNWNAKENNVIKSKVRELHNNRIQKRQFNTDFNISGEKYLQIFYYYIRSGFILRYSFSFNSFKGDLLGTTVLRFSASTASPKCTKISKFSRPYFDLAPSPPQPRDIFLASTRALWGIYRSTFYKQASNPPRRT